MTDSVAIQGDCDPRFQPLRRTFEENFRSADELGAAVAVTFDGEPVVDLWGGHADTEKTRPWQRDTIVNVFSTTKGMTAICAHQLVEQGRLDFDAPVARYWPEFGQAGKERVPLRWLLSHRSGVPAVKELLPPEALYDWDAMVTALAAQAPWWTPGEKHGYQAVTYGWLVGEVVRRVTGKSLGNYFREEIAEPLGMDFHIGLAECEHGRVADMTPLLPDPESDGVQLATLMMSDPEGVSARAFLNPPSLALAPNNADWRRAEIPGANGHGTARALARVYGALARGGSVDGVHVLRPESIARCQTEQSFGADMVLLVETRFGLGFMLNQERREGNFGPSPRAFGHTGAGGSFAYADPDARIGFAYVMNRAGPHILLDPRASALIDALYESLGRQRIPTRRS